ncbi:sensor histidine kinase [Tropicibacter alexandrii]|uniref:sensor histidine kinase n=1 Tax=Tropicibacter alexandrii TaxID=2267683 RepID=UPI000EF517C3|nr:sensor histidine kinase [Tropicibacter alexandrii]
MIAGGRMRRLGSYGRSLSVRLVLLLTLALLPLGLLSLYQTKKVLDEAEAMSRTSLMSKTVAASHAERELFQKALGAAEGLGALVLAASADTCRAAVTDFIAEHSNFVFAGFIEMDGRMRCSSHDEELDFAGTPDFEDAITKTGPHVVMRSDGIVSGEAVAIVIHPIMRRGVLQGLATVSIPLRVANETIRETQLESDLRLLTVNNEGEIVVSTDPDYRTEDLLPRDVTPEQLVGLAGSTFEALAGSGTRRLFAVSELIPGSVVLVGSAPYENSANLGGSLQGRMALAFPLVMWIAGMGVAYLGVQRLVVRHVRALRSAMRRFALGDRAVGSLALDNPPEELAEAERAFNRMALLISEAEQRRDQDLRDKKVLLKEVHHRVKNNLQLIASIMNMQMRSAQSAEARGLLSGLQQRVRGLAMLHRALYAAPDLTTVDAAELLQAVIEDVAQSLGRPDVTLETHFESVELYPDQAVPLSMLAAEALTNALKYARAPGQARIEVHQTFAAASGQVTLRVANSCEGAAAKAGELTSSGLGQKLMRAFEAQLNTLAAVTESDDSYVYEVSFTREEFDQGASERKA